MNGKFITFEGGDGVGKSTQLSLLGQKLLEYGVCVYTTREPGGSIVGEKIRDILKSTKDIDPIADVLLLFAARREHFVKSISPLLDRGYFVLCDRFYDSSLVYQGVLKNISFEDIMELKRIVLGDFEPNLTIILDMDVEISCQRLRERRLIPDEYDIMNMEQHERIRQGFRKIAEIFSFRSVLINAVGSEEKVASRIFDIVKKAYLTS
jgi:dTMP kinase